MRRRPLVEVVPDYVMDTVTGETMPSMEDTVFGCKADSWLQCIEISIDIYICISPVEGFKFGMGKRSH